MTDRKSTQPMAGINVRIHVEQIEYLHNRAASSGTTFSEVIRSVLWAEMIRDGVVQPETDLGDHVLAQADVLEAERLAEDAREGAA